MFNFIKRSLKCNFGVDKEYYRFIDKMFGFTPNNIELYKVALIHKSASQSVGGHHINNERLEYLGDAVIETVTSEYLFIEYPDRDEGFLTQMRSKIVSRQALNEMAVLIGLDKYIISNGAANSQQKHIYGDAFEAMMGAVYLDKGYEFTNRLLINDIFKRFLSMDKLPYEENDFKSRLIEWCQKNHHSLEFKTRKGFNRKNSAPVFYATAVIDGIEVGHGSGDSKKSAEQKAAQSVSHELTDKECARLLDRFDWLMDNKTEEGLAAKHRAASKPNVETHHEDEVYVEYNEEEDVEAAASETASTPAEQPARKRRGRKKRAAAAEKPAVAEISEVVSEPEVQAAPEGEASEQPKKRRGRKKKSEAAAEAVAPVAEDGHQDATEGEQPKKRRGRRKKSETAAAEVTAEAPASAEAAAEQPKKRRGRRKKTVETTPESAE